MSKTLFLSSVTSEFGQFRQRLANMSQRTKKCMVRDQDHFFRHGVKTLQMLMEEIQASDLVVHLIGAEAGWCVPADQAEAFLQQQTDFGNRFPDVAQQGAEGKLPATQWEAWLGLYFNKRFYGFQLQTTAVADPLQVTHINLSLIHI